MKYEEYIQSPEWQQKRREYFKSSLPQGCQGCGEKRELHLHHKTYERLGCEKLTDLVPVCQSCHAAIHERHRMEKELSLWDATELVLEKLPFQPRRQLRKQVEPWKGQQPRPISAQKLKRLTEAGERGRRRPTAPSRSWEQRNAEYVKIRDAEEARLRALRMLV